MAWAEKTIPKEPQNEEDRTLWRLRPPKFYPALVVIDMQNGFCAQGGSYEKSGADINTYRKIIPNIRKIIDVCHKLRISVFYTQQVREASGIDLLTRRHHIIPKRRLEFTEKIHACVRGTWDAEIIDELMPTDDDHIVAKRRDSAFQDTEFELWLESVGADAVIYTGIDTCICVENSFREGFNKGFDVILVEDAVASSWENLHKATLEKARGSFGLVLTTEQLVNMFQATKHGPSAFSISMEHL